jgi:hypothetical protein
MWHMKGVYVQLSDKSNMVFINNSLVFYITGGSVLVWKFSEVVCI